MDITFGNAGLVELADRLRSIADKAETNLATQFGEWVDETHEIMRDEVPVLSGELRDSIEVRRHGKLSAEIIPTKRVEGKSGTHSLGFIIEFGVGNRPPDPFISRTAERSREATGAFVLGDLL